MELNLDLERGGRAQAIFQVGDDGPCVRITIAQGGNSAVIRLTSDDALVSFSGQLATALAEWEERGVEGDFRPSECSECGDMKATICCDGGLNEDGSHNGFAHCIRCCYACT